MQNRITTPILLFKAVFLFVLISIQSDCLKAQAKFSFNKNIHTDNGRFHLKKGWINSFGFSLSPLIPFNLLYEISEGIGRTYPLQLDYNRYKLIKPKVGIGGGMAFTFHPTGELGYERFTHYKFADVYGYAKFYLINSGKRPYIDAKVGYGLALDKRIKFGCYSCSQTGLLYLRYTSGPMIQPGFGVEFGKSRKFISELKFSSSFTFISSQRDFHEQNWQTTPTGIIKRSTRKTTLQSLYIGYYLNI